LPLSNTTPSGATSILSTIDQMILNLYNSKDASAAAIYGSRAANG
jgi:iron complex outermembrane receptor protein